MNEALVDDYIDYKNLLRKYMNHVGVCEGIVFMDKGSRVYSSEGGVGDIKFTDEEWKVLEVMADES